MIMRTAHRHARAFTLIEMLIVIAIIAILTDSVFRLYIATVRSERGADRQREALEEMMSLEHAWRGDVGAARAVKDNQGGFRAGRTCLVLQMDAAPAGSGRIHVYSVAPSEQAQEVCIDRSIFEADGRLAARQRLASTMNTVEFGEATSGVLTLSLAAQRGFAAHNTKQQYTAMAVLGGAK